MNGDLFGAQPGHDPGGKHRWRMQPGVRGTARFAGENDCRRITLERWWGSEEPPADFALWVGMNPSTAAWNIDDPTIRRDIGFTRRIGLSRMVKVNIMDYRATNPLRLMADGVEPCGPENLPAIAALAAQAKVIIAAWGGIHPKLRQHEIAARVVLIDAPDHIPIFCLGVTADGSPRHPLYVRKDAPFETFRLWGGDDEIPFAPEWR